MRLCWCCLCSHFFSLTAAEECLWCLALLPPAYCLAERIAAFRRAIGAQSRHVCDVARSLMHSHNSDAVRGVGLQLLPLLLVACTGERELSAQQVLTSMLDLLRYIALCVADAHRDCTGVRRATRVRW